ncbi:unnamed protein product [Parajaminaea phylloscopi]
MSIWSFVYHCHFWYIPCACAAFPRDGAAMASSSVSNHSQTTARALSYLTERAEDAQAALMGILGGSGPGASGPSGAERYLADVDLGSGEAGVKTVRSKLESSSDYERLDGLRTVVAMITRSLPAAHHLFPSVLKLASEQSLQIKTLVYLITLRLAPSQPDVTLLSINSFQRDLSDQSALIRGMALRVLSGLGVKTAGTIMEMAITKSVRDSSFYTRRIAADAIGKCYELSRSRLPSLIAPLSTLLADRHPSVLGSALLTFSCMTPGRYELLHPHYRRICHALVDIDEWNQPIALQVLIGYARTNLPKPSQLQTSSTNTAQTEKWGATLDSDLELLLSKAELLLLSRNSATVVSTAHLYFSILPLRSPYHRRLVQPLLRLLHCPAPQAHVALLFIRALHTLRDDLFEPHVATFIPAPRLFGEPLAVSLVKLDVLVDIALSSTSSAASSAALDLAMGELEEAALHRPESEMRTQAIRCIGRLTSAAPTEARQAVFGRCIEVVLTVVREVSSSAEPSNIGAAAMGVIRSMISSQVARNDSATAGDILHALAGMLYDAKQSQPVAGLKDASGRAAAFWLLGQHCRLQIPVRMESSSGEGRTVLRSLAETVLVEVLRKAAVSFAGEERSAKLAILAFSSKLSAVLPTTDADASYVGAASAMHGHLLQLGRFDVDFDVRDRSRYYKSLTSGLGHAGAATTKATTQDAGNADVGDGAALGGDGVQDDERIDAIGGVRLRREQVIKVLFDGKDAQRAGPDSAATDARDPAHVLDLWAVSREAFGGRGPHATYQSAIPAWASSAAKLPPASVRDAVVPVAPSQPELTPGDVTLPVKVSAGVRSLSSDDFARSRGGRGSLLDVAGSATPESGSRTPTVITAPQGKGKYKDLDSFLAEDDGEGESESGESEESEESSSAGSESEEAESEGDDGESEGETASEDGSEDRRGA